MVKNLFRQRAPLTKRERRYCTCLSEVRGKSAGYNPYAVCTQSVYTSQGATRKKRVDCETNYNLSKMPMKSLSSLAKEKRISIKSKKGTKVSKQVLIGRLTKRIQEKKGAHYRSLKNTFLQKK